VVADEPWSAKSSANFSQGFSLTEFWVDADAGAMSNNTYYAASGLDVYVNYTIRICSMLVNQVLCLLSTCYSGVLRFPSHFVPCP